MDDLEFLQRRIGSTIRGKWKIERLLGAGGMAAVYVAVHSIGHRVAIKILHPEIAASSELQERFKQEAHAVNLFSHPGAVSISDHDVAEDGCPFLVMELLEGESVAARLEREKQLEPQEVLRIADELLDVLAAAHAHGIVHRDIKPDNLFLLTDGRLKVLDFGIARMLEGSRAYKTRTGVAMGTITYMPPEQIRGEHIDARADLFAVGATMFRLLTGHRLHDAESHADMLIKMASTPAPSLSTVAPGLPPGLCKVVDCALAFRKEDRYADALSMQADVRALRQGRDPASAAAAPLAVPLAFAKTTPDDHPISSRAAAAAPLDATRPDVPANIPKTIPDQGPPPSNMTWRSGEQPPQAPVAHVSVPAVQVVPSPVQPKKTPLVPIIVAVSVVAVLLLAGAIALAAWAWTGRDDGSVNESDAGPGSTAGETPGPTPLTVDTSGSPPAGTVRVPPGKTAPVSTVGATPGATVTPGSTTAAAPPLTTSPPPGVTLPIPTTTTPPPPTATATTPPPTATATTPPPQSTGGKPPKGKDKDKDKGKK